MDIIESYWEICIRFKRKIRCMIQRSEVRRELIIQKGKVDLVFMDISIIFQGGFIFLKSYFY